MTTVVWLANCYGNMDTNTVTQTTTSAFENMVSGSYCIIANRVKCGIDSSVQWHLTVSHWALSVSTRFSNVFFGPSILLKLKIIQTKVFIKYFYKK